MGDCGHLGEHPTSQAFVVRDKFGNLSARHAQLGWPFQLLVSAPSQHSVHARHSQEYQLIDQAPQRLLVAAQAIVNIATPDSLRVGR